MCGVKYKKQKLWKAKRIAFQRFSGNHERSYNKLYKYANVLRLMNHGTFSVVLCTRTVLTENFNFQRFFLSFYTQKDEFLNGCKPLFRLDGCHSKGLFSGVLLSAVALDEKSGRFPLSIAINKCENLASWGSFMRLLMEYIGVQEMRPITFMSDRQKWILAALAIHFFNSPFKFCMRHIFANLKNKFSGIIVRKLF